SFSHPAALDDFSKMPNLEDTGIFDDAYDDRDEGAEADYNNLETVILISPIPSTRIHKDHPKEQIIGEVNYAVQIRKMTKQNEAGLITFTTRKEEQIIKISKIVYLLVFSLIWNQRRQEEGIYYDEVFAHVARIEAIRLFLAYASFMDFTVYQMDVKSVFLYGTIEKEVYVSQPPGFVHPEFPNRVYKVEKALYGLHQAPRAWYETLSNYLLDNEFRRWTIDKTLFIKKIKDDILLVLVYVDDIIFGSTKSQDKYVSDILKKFGFSSVKSASTPMETHKPLSKVAAGTDIDVHLYRYLKGQPTLGLWYPKVSPLELISYSDSDYAGASLDRKSTTGGCQFLGSRLIYWQCKKQTIVANSTTEAEYIAASNCHGQVLWLQNQLLDYGYNFMQTKIHVDNESAICVVKNPVYHSKTKHIEIKHHFIRDSYEKRLIEMVKIHTDSNVADILNKAFDVTRFQFLVASIGIELKEYLLNDGYANLVQHADKKELAIPRQMTTGKEFSNPLMAGSLPKTISAKFVDQHNMVAYLVKSDDNTEFHQIVDFLSSCSITYALTDLPGIFNDTYETPCHTKKIFSNMARKSVHFSGNVTPLFNNMLVQNQAPKGEGSAIPPEPQPTPSISQPPAAVSQTAEPQTTSVSQNLRADEAVNQEEGDRVERAITTDASLEATHDNGTSAQTGSERVFEQPNEPPLIEGHTSRSGEGIRAHGVSEEMLLYGEGAGGTLGKTSLQWGCLGGKNG
nr:hypothetical protein [Tanacetum cinerariifolium]